MRYRDTYIETEKVLADSATTLIDIKAKDPITQLVLSVFATNYAAANPNNPIAPCVTNIELVDGSDVLYKLSGQQAIAMSFYDMKHMPHREINEWTSNRQVDHFVINFGRFLGDPELAFDPKQFTNPQLKVTHNLATITAVGSGGYATGTGRLSLIAKLMESPAMSPIGLLLNKEHFSWVNAASGDESIALPTDYPYRKLCVRSYEAGTELISAISKLKLSCDSDKFIPFELYTVELVRMMEAWFGKAIQSYQHQKNNSAYLNLWMDMDIHCFGNMEGATPDILGFRDPWANRVQIQTVDNAGIAGSDESGHLTALASCVESAMCYPFGRQDVIEDWFPAPEFGDIKLKATQGDADGLSSVFMQQFRRY